MRAGEDRRPPHGAAVRSYSVDERKGRLRVLVDGSDPDRVAGGKPRVRGPADPTDGSLKRASRMGCKNRWIAVTLL